MGFKNWFKANFGPKLSEIEKETEVDEELKQSKEEKNESEMTEQSDEFELYLSGVAGG